MVVFVVVDVDGKDVVVFAARIPGGDGRTFGVENPNHVLHALDLYHAVKYQAVEGCELVARIDTPPEPLAARFVQGAEYACNAFFLQFEEVVGDMVDVGDNSLVVEPNLVEEVHSSVFKIIEIDGVVDVSI